MSPTPQSLDEPRDPGVAKVAELKVEAEVCMLTTTRPDGGLAARPMGQREVSFDGDLSFFIDATSAKAAQIRATPAVDVSFSEDRHGSWTPGLTLITVRADFAQHSNGLTSTAGRVSGAARAALILDLGKDPVTNESVAP